MDPDLLRDVKTLTGLDRLRILGRLAEAPADPGELSAALGRSRRIIVRELGLLAEAGLVEPLDPTEPNGRWVLRRHGLMDIGRRLDALESRVSRAGSDALGGPTEAAGASTAEAKVLRSFIDDGRLVAIPVQEKKREIVLDWVLERCFADDRAYPEREVNARLAEVHPDTASLRRYLVDSGRMTRASGEYRRATARVAAGRDGGPAGS